MYNGIGLTTPRGSGTNGYIQTNKAHVRSKKDRIVEYQSEEEIQKAERLMFREPNKDILEHERKRRIEAKCFEMQDLMEEQGYKDSEIEDQVNGYREALMAEEFGKGDGLPKGEMGKPLSNSTHAITAANKQKNDQLKTALNISADFKEGSSLQKKMAVRKEAEKEKSKWIDSDHSSSSASSSSSSESSDSDSDGKDDNSSDLSPKVRKKHHSSKNKSKKSKKSKKKRKTSKKKSKKIKDPVKVRKGSPNDTHRDFTTTAPSDENSPGRGKQVHSTVSDKRKESARDHRSKYPEKEMSEFRDEPDIHNRRRPSSREDSREEVQDNYKEDYRSRNYDDYGTSDFRRSKHSDRYDESRKSSMHDSRRAEEESYHHHGHSLPHHSSKEKHSKDSSRHHHHHHDAHDEDYEHHRKRHHNRELSSDIYYPHDSKRRK